MLPGERATHTFFTQVLRDETLNSIGMDRQELIMELFGIYVDCTQLFCQELKLNIRHQTDILRILSSRYMSSAANFKFLLSTFEQFLHFSEHHFPVLLGMIGVFLGIIIILRQCQPCSAAFSG